MRRVTGDGGFLTTSGLAAILMLPLLGATTYLIKREMTANEARIAQTAVAVVEQDKRLSLLEAKSAVFEKQQDAFQAEVLLRLGKMQERLELLTQSVTTLETLARSGERGDTGR